MGRNYKERILGLILFSVIFLSCNSRSGNQEVIETVFEIENLNDKSISFDSLKENGFKLIYDDVTIFQKKNNDTIIRLYINDDLKVISKKEWKIKLKSIDKEYVQKLMYKNNVFLVTPILNKSNSNYFFSALRNFDNQIYTCNVKEENGENYLSIEYYKPYIGNNLLKSKEEMYQKWEKEQEEHAKLNFDN